jgi:hypothetical protein
MEITRHTFKVRGDAVSYQENLKILIEEFGHWGYRESRWCILELHNKANHSFVATLSFQNENDAILARLMWK